MTVTTAAGTTFALSASTPVSSTVTGYDALVYTEIGEVGDLGDIPSLIYETVSWRAIGRDGENIAKDGYSYSPQTITVGLDPDDQGQSLLDAATQDDGFYSVRISHPRIGDFYGKALVLGGPTNLGNGSGIATRQVTLRYVDVLHIAAAPANAVTISGAPMMIGGMYLTLGAP
jgi:hypothetical protein